MLINVFIHIIVSVIALYRKRALLLDIHYTNTARAGIQSILHDMLTAPLCSIPTLSLARMHE